MFEDILRKTFRIKRVDTTVRVKNVPWLNVRGGIIIIFEHLVCHPKKRFMNFIFGVSEEIQGL